MKPLTLLIWIQLVIAMLGLIGFEMIQAHLRGLWALIIIEFILGAFLQPPFAIALGVITFLAAIIGLFLGMFSEGQTAIIILAFIFIPLAPMTSSAIKAGVYLLAETAQFNEVKRNYELLINPKTKIMTTVMLSDHFSALTKTAENKSPTINWYLVENYSDISGLLGKTVAEKRLRIFLDKLKQLVDQHGYLVFVDTKTHYLFALVKLQSDAITPNELIDLVLAQEKSSGFSIKEQEQCRHQLNCKIKANKITDQSRLDSKEALQ
ncbi:hypothetical protein [Polycladidibacter stylochi]|uniref:hypothetical protein n=1 Tax=Polycladidibacter stylochi TaxID=1807766 RepID=UPI00083415F1|nr:hypothetical protein [Pseudovibrio stylochi]